MRQRKGKPMNEDKGRHKTRHWTILIVSIAGTAWLAVLGAFEPWMLA
jgi:hypothetical protein